MTVRKRTTQKTGNGSRRTTTLSSTGGKTVSYSNKPTKQSPRRTVSFNHKTGRTRTTYSQKLGGGFTRITSKTTGPKKYKYKSSSGSGDMGAFFGLVIFSLLLLSPIMYIWPVTIYFIVGTILAIVSIVVLVNIVFLVLPWVIWGSILYGLYNLIKFML